MDRNNDISLHATCVSVNGQGVLLLGESGEGKSDLAIRLIDGGAQLVSDDRVLVRRQEEALVASAPEAIAGMLEVRGIGIVKLPHAGFTPLALAVSLLAREQVERMPEPAFFDCLGLRLPLLSLHAFDASTPAKIRLWLARKG